MLLSLRFLILGLLIFFVSASSFSNLLQEPLPPEKAFKLNSNFDNDQNQIEIIYQIEKGYYLYRNKISVKTLNPDHESIIQAINLPTGIDHVDKFFGKSQIYRHQLLFTIATTQILDEIDLLIKVQGCADFGICYPPFEQVLTIFPDGRINLPTSNQPILAPQNPGNSFSLSKQNPAASKSFSTDITQINNHILEKGDNQKNSISEVDQLTQKINNQNIFWTIALFFSLGFALSLTPCVLPMIPILGALITSHTNFQNQTRDYSSPISSTKPLPTKFKNFLLAVAFVLGTSITYSIVGIIAGFTGGLLTSTIQLPIFQIFSAIIIVLLAFACFGFFQIQMPGLLQNFFQNLADQQSKSWLGLMLAGALSALIIGPCVAAPLIAILLYISQTGDAIIGGGLLFTLAWGQGIPLLAFGIFSDKVLPKFGTWMESINSVFGFLLILLAIWIISPLISNFWELILYGSFFIIVAIFLRLLEPLPSNPKFSHKILKSLSIIIFIYGISLLIGALSGSNSLINPLAKITINPGTSSLLGSANLPNTASSTNQWQIVVNIQEYQAAVEQSLASQKPTIIKYYADWCISCKEFNSFTAKNQQVQDLLKNFHLIEIDVTQNNAETNKLLKLFNLFGPPAFIFLDNQNEISKYRLIGIESSDDFAKRLKSILEYIT